MDHRLEPRIPEKTNVTVVIESAPAAPELEGMMFPSSSVDISMHGLLLIVSLPVPVGTQLELRVMFSHLTIDYWHTGEVVWDQFWPGNTVNAEHLRLIGIHFTTRDNPQYYSWRTAIRDLLKRHARERITGQALRL